LQKDLTSIFPQLEGVKFESMWGGPLAYGRDMFPMIGKKEEGYWYMTGFGGHGTAIFFVCALIFFLLSLVFFFFVLGLVPTTVAGELIADAIANERGSYMQFQNAFPLKWIGAPLFSGVGVQLMYWAYQVRDSYNMWRSKL
jgi:gamma-glutamylputrescine oxidase